MVESLINTIELCHLFHSVLKLKPVLSLYEQKMLSNNFIIIKNPHYFYLYICRISMEAMADGIQLLLSWLYGSQALITLISSP